MAKQLCGSTEVNENESKFNIRQNMIKTRDDAAPRSVQVTQVQGLSIRNAGQYSSCIGRGLVKVVATQNATWLNLQADSLTAATLNSFLPWAGRRSHRPHGLDLK